MQSHLKSPSDLVQNHPAYRQICQQLATAGINLEFTRKRVKNINFRLKPHLLTVSAPIHLSDQQVVDAIDRRLGWIISQHPKVMANYANRQLGASQEVRLWGKAQPFVMGEAEQLVWYRASLAEVMPSLFAKWQVRVGQVANEYRIKKMTSRWGSCNIRARRVWLSVYLPAFPIECTEYVIVHELCHLHHANHSPAFWREVSKAMPDYGRWHDMLAGRGPANMGID